MVERWFWEPDVAGSNPVSPTTLNFHFRSQNFDEEPIELADQGQRSSLPGCVSGDSFVSITISALGGLRR